jgi:DNA transposition AAA+ family ATPase
MSAHYLTLRGARPMNTMPFRLAQTAVADIVDANAMGVIHGQAGLGKTFSVDYALNHTLKTIDSVKVEFAGRPTMKYVATTLLRAITGVDHHGERFALTQDLTAVLAEQQRLIVVDEAQRLNHECIEYLRHLHDNPDTCFALCLVGGNGCWSVLSQHAMLKSRVYRRVAFEPMTGVEVLQIIPGYHPIYREAARDLLLLIDDTLGHGNWRHWASFTHSAARLCDEHGTDTVTEEIARFVFALMGGGRGNT